MRDIDTTAGIPAPSPHPLARTFADELRRATCPRALLLGYGSGRNVPVVLESDASIALVEPDDERRTAALERYASDSRLTIAGSLAALAADARFAGLLATHALLHGTPRTIAATLAAVVPLLAAGAPLAMVLGSRRDPRYGAGRKIDHDVYAPLDGSEAGVPHAYFDERGVRALLAVLTIESLVEDDASQTAGAWAHTTDERATLRHWFVRARVRVQ